MPGGQKWTLQQLGGAKKKLELTGYHAPFGRPRKEPIFDDGVGLRMSVERYAGNDEPTYHVFGNLYDDWELHGRWMDFAGGPGFARAMVQNVKSFVADAQPIRISWGDVRTVIGLAEKIVPSWESEADVAWKLTLKISRDLKLGTTPTVPKARAAESYTNRMIEAMSDVLADVPNSPPSLRIGFVESLDSLISFINAPSALLVSVANQMSDLERGTVAEIRRFAAGLAQYRTGLTSLRTTFESAPTDLALAFQEADDELRLMQSQAIFGKTMAETLAESARADKALAGVERSKVKAIYSAKQGDTWEQVSVQVYGSSSRVKDILQSNSLPAGSQPTPGTDYFLPT